MAKKINLSKNEAFFEGFKILLNSFCICDFDDNNRLLRDGKVVNGVPCLTPKAALNSLADMMKDGDDSWQCQYPNFAIALGDICGAYGLLPAVRQDYGDELYDIPNSVSYYEKAISRIFSTGYRHHYKLVITGANPSVSFDDTETKQAADWDLEAGQGIYKYEIYGDGELKYSSTSLFTSFFWGRAEPTEIGAYDVYIYSTLPTISIENMVAYNCTFTYLESEHLVQYVLTATDAGKAVISGYLGSIVDVQADASVTVEGDAETNLFTLSFDRAGQYIVKLFCNESAEEMRVQDSENCSFGNRTLVW